MCHLSRFTRDWRRRRASLRNPYGDEKLLYMLRPERRAHLAALHSTSVADRDSRSIIRIVAALIVNADGHVLLVRKRDTTAFMQPGGKIEEIAWIDLARPGDIELAPLTRDAVFELLRS